MSVSQFERAADELPTCELERGEVVRLSPAGYFHNRAAMNIAMLLETWARKTRRGRVVSNETGIVTADSPGTVRGADVLFVSYRRLPRAEVPEGFLRVPPELIVEVVGPRQNWQRVLRKAGEYFEMGVDRVWIVDPKRRRVHVYRPDDEPTVFDETGVIRDADLLPGFRCKVRELFAE